MKIACPECRKVVKAPDEWAGKRMRCPGCKAVIALPKKAGDTATGEVSFNLESLGAIEAGGQMVQLERPRKPMTLKEAQAAQAAERPPDAARQEKQDPTLRTCPRCGQKARSVDIYIELICRHCGSGIPGADIDKGEKAKYTDGMAGRMITKVSFYTGFTGAVAYPLPAITHILLGVGVALGAIAVPLGGVLAFLGASALNPAAEQPDFGWVGPFLSVMFLVEAIYFGAVGYYVLIDTIRATTAGNEQPPSLTWNVISLGSALTGYGVLLALYALVVVLLVVVSGEGFPVSAEQFAVLSRPFNLIVLVVLTFGVPMNIIGLSSGNAFDGLHPVKVVVSIGKTIGHYIFLFLITVLAMGFYAGIMYAVLNWAGPAIMRVVDEGVGEGISLAGILNILGALAAWSVVIGAGFYFAYSLGRILGLFARTYRENMEFEV